MMRIPIHVVGLSCFCTDDKLRRAFLPFGTVLLTQVLKDECGHALGLGIVHMARSEEAEEVLRAQQPFDVAGSGVNLWVPAEPECSRGEQILAQGLRTGRAATTGQDARPDNGRNRFQRLAVPRHRLIQAPAPSSPIAPSLSSSRVN